MSQLLTFLVTKINKLPALKNSIRFCNNHVHLPVGLLLNTITCCVTSAFASPTSPWTILTGSVKTSLASFSTLFLKVALNNNVCLSGLTWLHIERTCGSGIKQSGNKQNKSIINRNFPDCKFPNNRTKSMKKKIFFSPIL